MDPIRVPKSVLLVWGVGAHTLGRCHFVRSGYDGKWTRSPLRFDNEYFRNLIHYTWKPREWDGQPQYTDVATGELMMLPTDVALKTTASATVTLPLPLDQLRAEYTKMELDFALGCWGERDEDCSVW